MSKVTGPIEMFMRRWAKILQKEPARKTLSLGEIRDVEKTIKMKMGLEYEGPVPVTTIDSFPRKLETQYPTEPEQLSFDSFLTPEIKARLATGEHISMKEIRGNLSEEQDQELVKCLSDIPLQGSTNGTPTDSNH